MSSRRPSKKQRKPRSPGRPAKDLALREQLLEVARREFAAHGFRGTSVAEIAKAADATPAMIYYYFSNKRGLYRAMLEQTLGPFLANLEAGLKEAGSDDEALPVFVRAYMNLLAASPDIPALILRDVLSPGGEMRDDFVKGFAGRAAPVVRRALQQGIESGRLRADLDPDLATLSLLSLVVFPFMSAPVASQVLDYSPTPEGVERLAGHVLEMFYRGAGANSNDKSGMMNDE